MKKILYGVCGIGNGHTYRQLPTLNYLAGSHKIMIFAYGDSLAFFSSHFAGHTNVQVTEVAVPYYVGSRTGIDFATTAKQAAASGIDYAAVNNRALHKASRYLGKADVVISDYEPVCAQYAYAYSAPLITIDQQSKYLAGDFPAELHGHTYIDEVVRLRMFFPLAAARIACSFFAVPHLPGAEKVHIFPPVLRSQLEAIKKSAKRHPTDILVYLTAQEGFEQSLSELVTVLAAQSDCRFHAFLPPRAANVPNTKNVVLYRHGDEAFASLLGFCSGIITTAGHGVLSEAMYLGVPVLAMPLPLYEQQMNASVIAQGAFGVSASKITSKVLRSFTDNLPSFAANIKNDTELLVRGNGQQQIIGFLERQFL